MTAEKPLELTDIFIDEYDKHNNGKSHKITVSNNIIHIRSEDPYGFWHLSLDKGQLPEKYKGAYTHLSQAIRAAQTWTQEKKLAIVLPTKEQQTPNSKGGYASI